MIRKEPTPSSPFASAAKKKFSNRVPKKTCSLSTYFPLVAMATQKRLLLFWSPKEGRGYENKEDRSASERSKALCRAFLLGKSKKANLLQELPGTATDADYLIGNVVTAKPIQS
ncbi:hypothetical protein TNIN_7151 [Trichonephila inaurata madagascariensis]|uniref:Uncharacterized protein n=1 Tax=Trichonephila inaurata madagascariensis TaxID=2747483 RepID=A0A8X6YS75_9ARAC|nr:hypothetical protein TNIN_7151 [Trichonephila inaurata madagascariensis]